VAVEATSACLGGPFLQHRQINIIKKRMGEQLEQSQRALNMARALAKEVRPMLRE